MCGAVLITGGNKGLGLALTRRYLTGGWQVFAGYHSGLGELALLCDQFNDQLVPIPLDVTSLASIHWASRLVASHTPSLDILINNAGIFPPQAAGLLETLDLGDGTLEQTFDVNTFGPLRMAQVFIPMLKERPGKTIINISSESGSTVSYPRLGEYAYAMSKAALNMLTKILYNALSPHGYTILAVHPGWMRTGMGGPDADHDPAEPAEGIYQLSQNPRLPGDPIFVDFKGNPMPW